MLYRAGNCAAKRKGGAKAYIHFASHTKTTVEERECHMKCCEKCSGLLNSFDKEDFCAHAQCAKEKASVLVAYLMEKARGFNVFDFAMLKICLLSFGLWIGSKFSKFFSRFKGILFLGFIFSYVFLIWRIFFREDD